ncbi:hypothetical protein A2G96_18225 [Cupriavidus nantongensis]|uniref:Polysaccharide biosynthesis protein n=2 Tax=Cupriavidus nantongensis TaxID=1796606 RepID=A0A142JN60_9BURK|nr:hypothetical protein A2G96_18225 [Cupriavidus nantongensis]
MRNVVALAFAEKVSQAASLLLVQAMLARSLGPTTYGVWQYTLSAINLVGSLALVCSSEILVAAIIQRKDQAREWLWSAFFIRLAVSMLCMVAVAIYLLGTLPAEYYTFALILCSLLILAEPFAVSIAYFQAIQRYPVVSITRLAILAVKLLALWIALRLQWSISLIALIWILEFVCFNILMSRYLAQAGILAPILRPELLLHLLKAGATVWAGFCFMYLIQRVDMLILRRSIGFDLLGSYAAPKALIESWYGFGWLLSQILAPALVYGAKTRVARFRLLGLMVALSVCAALVTTVAAEIILSLLFGSSYTGYSFILTALAWTGVLVFADAALSSFYFKQRHYALFMAKYFTAAAVYFVVLALQPSIQPISFIFCITAAYATCVMFSALYLRTQRIL